MLKVIRDYEAYLTHDGSVAIALDAKDVLQTEAGGKPLSFTVASANSLIVSGSHGSALINSLHEDIVQAAQADAFLALAQVEHGQVQKLTPCHLALAAPMPADGEGPRLTRRPQG